MTHWIELSHKTSTGHRIPGHQDGLGKCARLHGHTYEFDVQLSGEVLDEVGFVVDFGEVKKLLDEWDHRLLLWIHDPIYAALRAAGDVALEQGPVHEASAYPFGIVPLPFVPTAEQMAKHLAIRFATEFENVVFATVTVRESDATASRFTSTQQEANYEIARAALSMVER